MEIQADLLPMFQKGNIVQKPLGLPHVTHLKYQPWPEDEGVVMEFRLIYRGSLPAQSSGGGGSRVKDKHAIRKQLHWQLKELWHRDKFLKRYTPELPLDDPRRQSGEAITILDLLANQFSRSGHRFIPLVKNEWGIACSIDILFLRRDDPGNLVKNGGDIDNRIKVLFDGLKVPTYDDLKGVAPTETENPMFCLLEDDSLITEIKVTTDRLLIPLEGDEHIHDVHLIMHIKTKIIDSERAFSVFAH